MNRMALAAVLVVVVAAPASALFGPVLVNDISSNIKLAEQVVNQGKQLANEAKQLTRIPTLNLGNVQSEVASVSGQANAIPLQIRGIVAAGNVLNNAPTAATRTAQVNASESSAKGAVGEAQTTNAHLSNLESAVLQGNAAAANDRLSTFANTADSADGLLTVLGTPKIGD